MLNNGAAYLPAAGEGGVSQWLGTYAATVVNNNDPLGVGRLQLNVPMVLGNSVSSWAVPAAAYFQIPANGATLSCVFLGGDPSQPAWNGPLDLSPLVESAAPPTVTYAASQPQNPRVHDIWYETFTDANGHTIIAAAQVWTFNYPTTGQFGWKVQGSSNNDNNGGAGVGSPTAGAGTIGTSQFNNTVTSRSIGGITTTAGPFSSQPSTASSHNGDIFIATDQGDTMYQFNGTAWSTLSFGSQALNVASVQANIVETASLSAGQITTGSLAGSFITAGTITANQIQAGSLNSSVIGNMGAILNKNPFFAGGSSSGWNGFQGTISVTSSPPAGAPYPNALRYTNNGTTAGAAEGSSGDAFTVIPGAKYIVTAWVYFNAGSSQQCQIGFDWTENGTFVTSNTQIITVPAATWTFIQTIQTAPTPPTFTINGGYIRVGCTSSNLGADIYIQAAQAFPQIQGIVDATTITGSQIIAEGTSGQFLAYSGQPTTGNLVASISAQAGSDGNSNSYNSGIWTYDSAGDSAGISGGALNLTFKNGSGTANTVIASGPSGTSFSSSGFTGQRTLAVGQPGPLVFVFDGTIAASVVNTLTPLATFSPATWTALTLQNGWTNQGGGLSALQYKLLPFNAVWVYGVISAGASTSTTFATLPAGYRPGFGSDYTIGQHGTPIGSFLRVATTGALTIFGASTTAAGPWLLNHIIPLDTTT